MGSQIRMALTVDQATIRDPERDRQLHCRLVQVIEEGDETAIAAEVRAHVQASVRDVIRRL